MKERPDKLDFIKIRKCCSGRGTVRIIKGQVTDWEKIFAKHIL